MTRSQRIPAPTTPPTGTYERLPVEKLLFDAQNPRLAEYGVSTESTQNQILEILWQKMAIEELAMSIVHNGFFEHEPLFIERTTGDRFVVLEGNRRLAAVKLLLDFDLRKRLRATDLPAASEARRTEIKNLPCIVTTRKDSWRYLGFKHVNGPATWGSYAKAQYIAYVRNHFHVSLEDIAAQIGDVNSTVERMYRGLMIIEQGEKEKLFDRSDTSKNRFHFNYIYTGMDYPGIRSFLKLTRGPNPTKTPVPDSRLRHLGELLVWLYGSKQKHKDSLIRSQNPDLKILDGIIASPKGSKSSSRRAATFSGAGYQPRGRKNLSEIPTAGKARPAESNWNRHDRIPPSRPRRSSCRKRGPKSSGGLGCIDSTKAVSGRSTNLTAKSKCVACG